jgi:hypothetical protein
VRALKPDDPAQLAELPIVGHNEDKARESTETKLWLVQDVLLSEWTRHNEDKARESTETQWSASA